LVVGPARVVFKAVLMLSLAALAAGCDSQAMKDASDSTIGGFRLLVGADQPDPNELQVDPDAPPPPVAAKCPPVVIRTGTETYRAYERGYDGDPGHIIYQGGIVKTARECEFISPNAIRIKFGIAGKVITGPSWNNGAVNLPLRAAFVRAGGDPVWTQQYDLQPTVLPGDPVMQFNQVDDSLYFEVPEGDHINNYVLYVGFDELGANGKRG
jgi:hypothetical protein